MRTASRAAGFLLVGVGLATALTGAACDSPTRPTVAEFGKPFTLEAGGSALVTGEVGVTFERVLQDSRCPLDALCIAAGNATIELTVTVRGDKTALELTTDSPGSERMASGYTFRLTELQPYPRASQPTPADDYAATVVVQRGTSGHERPLTPWPLAFLVLHG